MRNNKQGELAKIRIVTHLMNYGDEELKNLFGKTYKQISNSSYDEVKQIRQKLHDIYYNKPSLQEATVLALQGKLDEAIKTEDNKELNFKEDKIDDLLKDKSERVAQGPNRYLYAICAFLKWNPPVFIDPVVNGVRLRYTTDTEKEAEDILNKIKKAGDSLGIDILKSQVKEAYNGFYAYTVIPRYIK